MATVMIVAASASATAQKKYDDGASDTVVRIGNTGPISGPASAWGNWGTTMAAYFQMVNDQGGINGRKVEFIRYDDGYAPPKAVEMTRKAIESDRVLFMAGSLGTPGQLAVAPYLNERKIPQLFVGSGASKLADPKTFPYTMIITATYEGEGANWLKHIAATNPKAKVAIIYQDDDAGRAVLLGFKEKLASTSVTVVSEQSYTTTDPTIDSQIIAMKASGADVVLLSTITKMTSLALRKMGSLGWRPQIYLSQAGASVKGALEPAGLENATGLLTTSYRMQVDEKKYESSDDIKNFRAFMAKYLPGSSVTDDAFLGGYVCAQATAHVLKQAGDDLTRANIMKIATNLRGVRLPTMLPGITLNTTPGDYRIIRQTQFLKFNGKDYEAFGSVIGAD